MLAIMDQLNPDISPLPFHPADGDIDRVVLVPDIRPTTMREGLRLRSRRLENGWVILRVPSTEQKPDVSPPRLVECSKFFGEHELRMTGILPKTPRSRTIRWRPLKPRQISPRIRKSCGKNGFDCLSGLVETVRSWAQDLGWSPRQIEKKMEDSQIGIYKAPALILQKETVRVLLEPIARSAPGASGIVDLYLMPAYDDIASLYFYDGGWQLHYMFPTSPTVATIHEAEHKPLSKETLERVLEAMIKNAA